MTRLLTTGFETGDITETTSTQTALNGNSGIVTATPTPRSPGAYCLKFTGTSGAAGNCYRTWTLAASKTEIWTRFSIFTHALTAEARFFAVYDSAAALQGTVSWNLTDNLIRVYRGTSTALLGTSTLTMNVDQWHTAEVRWQITSTTVGIVEVWIDGQSYVNVTGVDNTNAANANVQSVAIGCLDNAMTSSGGGYIGFDDFAVNDTSGTINNGQIGDGRVVLLKPSGAGSNTAQTRGGTDSGANWSQVDEVPPSMTDYVFSATAGTRDTYALQDIPAGTWAVNCCEVLAYAVNSDAGAGSIGLTLKSGATTNEATAQALTTGNLYYRQLYETDPNTSAAWTNAAVNALEAGTTVR